MAFWSPADTRRAPSRTRRRWRIAALLTTALVFVTVDFRGPGGIIGSARDGTLEVLSPIQSFGGWVSTPFRNAWRGITDYDRLETENAELREELARANQDLLRVGDIQRELDDLRDEATLEIPGDIPSVVARVVLAPVSNFEQTLQIDKGTDHGLRVGMPVMTGGGLLGRLSQVTRTRSRVELITDPGVTVGVRLVRTADPGAGRGQGPGRPIVVDLIELDTPVIPGETVVTSGFEGSAYPPGLIVGTVVDVTADAVEESQLVEVAPAADADSARFVTVLLYRPTGGATPNESDLGGVEGDASTGLPATILGSVQPTRERAA